MQLMRGTLSFITCILAATCLTPQAFAAPDPALSFHPTKKWNIEVDMSGNANAQKTCSISNTFNNGFVLKLSGAQSGFKALEIDFRQDSFNAGKKYEVQYTIPGNPSQVFPTTAQTKNLLISNINGQQPFIQNLSQTGVLDLQIQNNSFRLYLTGLGAAMKEHAACVQPEEVPVQQASSEAIPVQQETPATPPIVAMEENIAQKVQQENLAPLPPIDPKMEAKLESNQAAPEVIEKEPILKPNADRPRFTEKLAQQMKSEGKVKNIPVTVEKKSPLAIASGSSANSTAIETESVQKPAAQRTFTRVPPIADTAQNIQQEPHTSLHTKEADAEVKKIETDGAVINKVRVSHAEIDLTKIKEKTSTAQNSQKNDQPQIAQDTLLASQDQNNIDAEMLSDIEPSSGAAKNDMHTLKDDGIEKDLRNKIIELEKQVSVLQKENGIMDNELKSVLKDAADERTTISSSNWDLERATMRYNEAEMQISRLGRQLQSSKSQCDMEKSELKAMLFDPKLTDQQQLAKLSSLEEDLDRTKTDLVVQKRTYEERIKLLEEQLNKQK